MAMVMISHFTVFYNTAYFILFAYLSGPKQKKSLEISIIQLGFLESELHTEVMATIIILFVHI